MVYLPLYMSGSWKTEKVTKEKNSVQIKLSSAFILVNVVLWLKFFYTGFVLDEFSNLFDWISLFLIVISSLYSLFCPLLLVEGYDWSLIARFTSILAILLGITSLVYALNVSSSDNFISSSTQEVNAKVVSKGTWSKKGSLVLASSDDVFTYSNVLNSTEVLVGDEIVSVSEGEVIRTYTDLLGLKTERRLSGFIFSKQ